MSRLLHSEVAPAQAAKVAAKRITDADLATVRQQVDEASAKYQAFRDTMPSGDQRTRRMEVVASRLRTLAQSVYPLLPELVECAQPGHRLAAVCALQTIPTVDYLDWLAERVCEEKPFIGYHAALGLLGAARILSDDHIDQVATAVDRAEACSSRLRPDADRATTLAYARQELARRTR